MSASDLVETRALSEALGTVPKPRSVVIAGIEPTSTEGRAIITGFNSAELCFMRGRSDSDASVDLDSDQDRRVRTIETISIEQGDRTPDLAIIRAVPYEGASRLLAKIDRACQILPPDGNLLLLTAVRRGAKGQERELYKRFHEVHNVIRRAGIRVFRGRGVLRRDEPSFFGDSFETMVWGIVFQFKTAPALFSKKHLDPGTRLLLEHTPRLDEGHIIDLGCGYGPIGIALAKRSPRLCVTLVDVDLLAVDVARANVALNAVSENATVVCQDGLGGFQAESADAIYLYFPLHAPGHELRKLLDQSHTVLKPRASFYGVTIRAYDTRPMVKDRFKNVETLCDTQPPDASSAYVVMRARRD